MADTSYCRARIGSGKLRQNPHDNRFEAVSNDRSEYRLSALLLFPIPYSIQLDQRMELVRLLPPTWPPSFQTSLRCHGCPPKLWLCFTRFSNKSCRPQVWFFRQRADVCYGLWPLSFPMCLGLGDYPTIHVEPTIKFSGPSLAELLGICAIQGCDSGTKSCC